MNYNKQSFNGGSLLIPVTGLSSRQLNTRFIKRLLTRWYWLDTLANDLTESDTAALTKLYEMLNALPEDDVNTLAARFYHAKPLTATTMANEQGCSLTAYLSNEAHIIVRMAAASQQEGM